VKCPRHPTTIDAWSDALDYAITHPRGVARWALRDVYIVNISMNMSRPLIRLIQQAHEHGVTGRDTIRQWFGGAETPERHRTPCCGDTLSAGYYCPAMQATTRKLATAGWYGEAPLCSAKRRVSIND
jgi:hypothetical protein